MSREEAVSLKKWKGHSLMFWNRWLCWKFATYNSKLEFFNLHSILCRILHRMICRIPHSIKNSKQLLTPKKPLLFLKTFVFLPKKGNFLTKNNFKTTDPLKTALAPCELCQISSSSRNKWQVVAHKPR